MDFDAPARMPFPPSVYGASRNPNAYSARTPLGASLEKLVTALYAGDPEGKQEERQSLVADRQAQAHLRDLQAQGLQQKADEAARARQDDLDAPTRIASGILGGDPQGQAAIAYRKAGGQQPPPLAVNDDEGNAMPLVPMARPDGYTPQKEDIINRALTSLAAAKSLSGKTTAEQWAHSMGELQDQGIKTNLLTGNAGTPDQVAMGLSLLKGTPIYHEGASGGTTNAYTGAVNQSTPVAVAKAGELTAQGVNQRAQAGSHAATTAKTQSETLPQVQVPAPPGVGAPGSTVPALGRDVSKEITKPSASQMTSDAIDDAATQFRATGVIPSSFKDPTSKALVQNRAAEQRRAAGTSALDELGDRADRKSTGTALTNVTKDLASIRPYKQMLDTNADIAVDLAQKAIATDAKLANHSINWLRQNLTDNPDVADFLAQSQILSTEAARVLNNPRLVGQLTDSARHEMQGVISGDMPLDAFTRVVQRMKNDGTNRVAAMEREAGLLRSKLGDGGSTNAGAPAPQGGGRVIRYDAQGNRVP